MHPEAGPFCVNVDWNGPLLRFLDTLARPECRLGSGYNFNILMAMIITTAPTDMTTLGSQGRF